MKFLFSFFLFLFSMSIVSSQSIQKIERVNDSNAVASVLEKEKDSSDEDVLGGLNIDDFAVGEVIRIVHTPKKENKEEIEEVAKKEDLPKKEELKTEDAPVALVKNSTKSKTRSQSHYGFRSRNNTIPTIGFTDKVWSFFAKKKNKLKTSLKRRKYKRNSCLSF